MALLHNIRTVARYEAITLRRSWFFRLFSLGALFIFTVMNIGLFSPVGEESWDVVSIPSSLPLINLYLLNIGQAVVVIFLAADFLKRDKKVDTNEVLYTRSMSNFEYVTGKTIGILRLFIGLDIIILSIGLIVNIISKSMSVDLLAYLSYLLIIAVPTLIFSLGLAFMLMSVIRNQAITFLLLLGIAALNIFWLWYRAGSLFDYMAFGLPIFKSGITGFGNISFIMNQRGLYFFLGLALILATVLLLNRLPQSKLHTTLSVIFMFIFIILSAICGYNTYSVYKTAMNEKKLTIESNRKFENSNFVSLINASIELIHKGNSFEASSMMEFINNNETSAEKYIFSLNPHLVVTSVTGRGRNMKFTRTNNIIEIEPEEQLDPGKSDSLRISYSGSISEAFCYPDYTENINELPYRITMVNVNKRQAFLTPDYVLLTPEAHWYPVPGLNYYPSNPARIKVDFAKYSLRVVTGEKMIAVSQGIMTNENGTFVFSPESPLTGLTLAIGDYRSDTLTIDSIKYITWYYPGHDFYKKELHELKDTLPFLVSGIMRELESDFSTKYPFKFLNLVEVPVQFYSYPKMSTQTRAELQPAMVLLPEKLSTLMGRGFYKQLARQKKNMVRQNQVITDKELQVRLFINFIRNTFISGENFRFRNGVAINEPIRFRMGPSFYFFRNNFYSMEFPVINAVFESHLQKVNIPRSGPVMRQGGMSDNDKANLILKDASFKDMLAKNPENDTIRQIVTVKGDYLFNLMRSRAGIAEFNEWFLRYIDNHKFHSVNILEMNKDVKERFGFEFYPYLDGWFNKKEQPGFLITDIQANEIIVNERVRYLVTFIVSNPEPAAGLLNISFRTGGPGGARGQGMIRSFPGGSARGGPVGRTAAISMQGRGMDASDISKIVEVGPVQAKKISIILDNPPRAMMVNTLFAKNIPGEIIMPVGDIKKSKIRSEETDCEEILEKIPDSEMIGEIIVDNEDPGFNDGGAIIQSPLKRILKIKNRRGNSYEGINMYWAPEYWQAVVQSTCYGKYILSSVVTRSGTGERSAKWSAIIKEPGYYDIYCYIGKIGDRISVRTGAQRTGPRENQAGPEGPGNPAGEGGRRGGNQYKDLHYKIYHDEGMEEITVDFESAEPGWNNMGRYYLTPDSAMVELTNQSTGRMVIGDAIKWIKVD